MDAGKPALSEQTSKNFAPRGMPLGRGKLLLVTKAGRIECYRPNLFMAQGQFLCVRPFTATGYIHLGPCRVSWRRAPALVVFDGLETLVISDRRQRSFPAL